MTKAYCWRGTTLEVAVQRLASALVWGAVVQPEGLCENKSSRCQLFNNEREFYPAVLCATWDSFPTEVVLSTARLFCNFIWVLRSIPAILNKWSCGEKWTKVWMLLLREEEVMFHLPLYSSSSTPPSSLFCLFIPCEPTGFTTVRCYRCWGCTTIACHNVARPVGPCTSLDTLIYFHCQRPQTMWLNNKHTHTHTEAGMFVIVVQTSVCSLFLVNLPPWCSETVSCESHLQGRKSSLLISTHKHTHTFRHKHMLNGLNSSGSNVGLHIFLFWVWDMAACFARLFIMRV